MTAASDADRQQEWILIVRRSFGISDLASGEDARRALVGFLEEQLQENGWHSATHAVADALTNALMAFGTTGELDDRLLAVELDVSADDITVRDAALQLVGEGMTVVDPEHLAYDVRGDYPPAIVATAEVALQRVFHYAREQPFDA